MTAHYVKQDGSKSQGELGSGMLERAFYDGLSRAIQAQTLAQDWNKTYQNTGTGMPGHENITSVQYDALGRTMAQSMPYAVNQMATEVITVSGKSYDNVIAS